MGCVGSKTVDEPAPAYFETSTSKSERVAVVSIPIHRPDPGAATEKPAGLGLKVATLENTAGARITEVFPGSNAAAAGLRVGDVVVEIDGRDVLNASHETVLNHLRSTAESVRLVVVPPNHKMLMQPTNLMVQEIDALARTKSRHASTSSSAAVTLADTGRRNTTHTRERLSTQLHRPTTSGWYVKMEGMLLKSKRSPGFKKSVSKRYFVLKVEPASKSAELEYYEGKTLKGAMTLQGATVCPGAGGSFVLHGPDRTWYMRPVDTDMQESLAWIKAIQCGIDRNWPKIGSKSPVTTNKVPQPDPIPVLPVSQPSETAEIETPLEAEVALELTGDLAVHERCPTAIIPPTAVGQVYPSSQKTRIAVPESIQSWKVPAGEAARRPPWGTTAAVPDYTPPEVTTTPENICVTFDGRCPPVDPEDATGIAFCVDETGLNRSSYAGRYTVLPDSGRPLCPWGRTGVEGRGAFARWGPNHFCTLVLTRQAREVSSGEFSQTEFEFLCLPRDGGGWVLPEGPVPPSERHTATAARIFRQSVLAHTCCATNDKARALILRVFDQSIDSYMGCLCDPRNTDNAWAETTSVGIHDPSGEVLAGCTYLAEAKWIRFGSPDVVLSPTHDLMIRASHDLHGNPVIRRRGTSSRRSRARSQALSTRFPSEEDLVGVVNEEEKTQAANEQGQLPPHVSESKMAGFKTTTAPSSENAMIPIEETTSPTMSPTSPSSGFFVSEKTGVTVDLNEVLRERCLELIRLAAEQAPEVATDEHWLYVVRADYTAEEEDEFSISRGDELLVHRQDEDGWWLASRIVDGKLGYLPSTYLESVQDSIESGQANDRLFRPSFVSVRAKKVTNNTQ